MASVVGETGQQQQKGPNGEQIHDQALYNYEKVCRFTYDEPKKGADTHQVQVHTANRSSPRAGMHQSFDLVPLPPYLLRTSLSYCCGRHDRYSPSLGNILLLRDSLPMQPGLCHVGTFRN